MSLYDLADNLIDLANNPFLSPNLTKAPTKTVVTQVSDTDKSENIDTTKVLTEEELESNQISTNNKTYHKLFPMRVRISYKQIDLSFWFISFKYNLYFNLLS